MKILKAVFCPLMIAFAGTTAFAQEVSLPLVMQLGPINGINLSSSGDSAELFNSADKTQEIGEVDCSFKGLSLKADLTGAPLTCGSGMIAANGYGCVATCNMLSSYSSYGWTDAPGNYGMVNGQCIAVTLSSQKSGACPADYMGYPLKAATIQGVAACCMDSAGSEQVLGLTCAPVSQFTDMDSTMSQVSEPANGDVQDFSFKSEDRCRMILRAITASIAKHPVISLDLRDDSVKGVDPSHKETTAR